VLRASGSAFVTLPDVSVLCVLDYALMCRIETHLRLIPKEQLRDGSTISQQGDVGVLVVPTAYAVEWGLVADDLSLSNAAGVPCSEH
jgi:hypothetical protein